MTFEKPQNPGSGPPRVYRSQIWRPEIETEDSIFPTNVFEQNPGYFHSAATSNPEFPIETNGISATMLMRNGLSSTVGR